MTNDSGQSVVDSRADEVARYVEEVRAALADLPAQERDELLEDLPAHLSEVAAEDPAPLRDRLGPPQAYAQELRAATGPAGREPRGTRAERWAARRERLRGQLSRLDRRAGPLLGYERASELGRLLLPGWWVLRGYLAAMVVVTLLDQQGQLGLVPRLGGSTPAGWAILAGFVVGSIWLGRRTPGLGRWQRRAMYVATAFLVVVGIDGFVGLDDNQRWGWPGGTDYVSYNPYENVQDVYPVDENRQLLTDVRLLDQHGNPIDIGWLTCNEDDPEGDPWLAAEEPELTYPRCLAEVPWWLPAPADPAADQE
jgi:hypothetical protein